MFMWPLVVIHLLAALVFAAEPDIPYVPEGGYKQQLDLYIPSTSRFPTVLFVHGGSLTNGDRKDEPQDAICRNFQRAGIGCALIGYRLAPEAKWPAQPRDLAAAFAWTRANIGRRGGDPARLFLVGHSSGCFLSAIVASDPRYLAEHALKPANVAGVVAMGCTLNPWDIGSHGMTVDEARKHFAVDREEVSIFPSVEDRIAANPSLYITGRLPPFLVMLAETERFQPPILEEGAAFIRKLIEAGGKGDLRLFANRKHYTLMHGLAKPGDPAFRDVLDFIAKP